MDFTRGYGIDYLEKAERKFYFDDSKITLCDKFTMKKDSEITERFVSFIEPVVDGKNVILDDLVLSPKDEIIPKITLESHPGHIGGTIDNVYCIDYVLTNKKTDFTIEFITPKE